VDAEFWLDRWRTGQTGWHQSVPHPFLGDGTFPFLQASTSAARRVFVPLCGASVDMAQLRANGFHVIGVDLAASALARFFEELRIAPRVDRAGALERWSADGYELYAGDFFALDRATLGAYEAVYDRGALVALPAPVRERYARALTELCAPGTEMALVTLDYGPDVGGGPPFAVPAAQVAALYGSAFDVELRARVDVLADSPRLRERGVSSVHECGYRLVRRA